MVNYIEIIIGILIAVMLVINTVLDISQQEVSVTLCMVIAILGSLALLISGARNIWQLVLGLIPGLFIILVSIISKGRIGMGDGIIVTAMGILWGIESVFTSLFLGMCMVGLISIVMLGTGKWQISKRIPFVPFLSVASAILAVCQVAGL